MRVKIEDIPDNEKAVWSAVYKPCSGVTLVDVSDRVCFGSGFIFCDGDRLFCDDCLHARANLKDVYWNGSSRAAYPTTKDREFVGPLHNSKPIPDGTIVRKVT